MAADPAASREAPTAPASPLPLTEHANPRSDRLDQLATPELLRLMNEEDATVPAAVARVIPELSRAVDALAARLTAGGRLLLFGAGTSGRLAALDAAEWPPTFGVEPTMARAFIAGGPSALTGAVEGAEDDIELGREDVRRAEAAAVDVALGISASGGAPYVLAAMDEARRRGALTVGLACRPDSPLETLVDIAVVPVVGPEVLTGSTRLKAGTAQKLVLNMLSTGAMVRLGKVLGNRMIDVRPTNAKLRARAARIIREVAGGSEEEAISALASAGSVRVAIVMIALGLDPDAAREELRRAASLGELLARPRRAS